MSSAIAVQELAAGKTIAQRNPVPLGYKRRTMYFPLSRLYGMAVGLAQSGKTTLFHSHPGAFIFNLDGSSTPSCDATVWPGVDSKGNLCEPADPSDPGAYEDPALGPCRSVTLDYETVLKKYQQVLDLPLDQRPETIVMDSMTTLRNMLKSHVLKNYPDKETWRDLGQNGWTELNEILSTLHLPARAQGLGFWWTCHIINTVVDLSGLGNTVIPELSVTRNFWSNHMHPNLEMVAPLFVEIEETTTKTPRMKEVNGRQVKTGDDVVVTKVRKGYIDFNHRQMAGIAKGRRVEGRIELPLDAGWTALEAVYKKAWGQA